MNKTKSIEKGYEHYQNKKPQIDINAAYLKLML